MNIRDGPEGFMDGGIMHELNILPGGKYIKTRLWWKLPKVTLERLQLSILGRLGMRIIRMFTGDLFVSGGRKFWENFDNLIFV